MSFPKHKPYESERYKEFVKTLDCSVHGEHIGDVVPHHTTSVGAGGGDLTCVPLCSRHHATIHTMGRITFAQTYNIDLWELQAKTLAAYVEEIGG